MKQKVKLAVAKIIALHAEFSDAEIAEAYEFIKDKELNTLLGVKLPPPVKIMDDSKKRRQIKRDVIARSSFVENIFSYVSAAYPERLKVLDELETKLRVGQLNCSLDKIRKIAMSLDKEVVVGKSKKEAVPKIIDLLAHATDENFREAVTKLYEDRPPSADGDEGYMNLASYILRGES